MRPLFWRLRSAAAALVMVHATQTLFAAILIAPIAGAASAPVPSGPEDLARWITGAGELAQAWDAGFGAALGVALSYALLGPWLAILWLHALWTGDGLDRCMVFASRRLGAALVVSALGALSVALAAACAAGGAMLAAAALAHHPDVRLRDLASAVAALPGLYLLVCALVLGDRARTELAHPGRRPVGSSLRQAIRAALRWRAPLVTCGFVTATLVLSLVAGLVPTVLFGAALPATAWLLQQGLTLSRTLARGLWLSWYVQSSTDLDADPQRLA